MLVKLWFTMRDTVQAFVLKECEKARKYSDSVSCVAAESGTEQLSSTRSVVQQTAVVHITHNTDFLHSVFIH